MITFNDAFYFLNSYLNERLYFELDDASQNILVEEALRVYMTGKLKTADTDGIISGKTYQEVDLKTLFKTLMIVADETDNYSDSIAQIIHFIIGLITGRQHFGGAWWQETHERYLDGVILYDDEGKFLSLHTHENSDLSVIFEKILNVYKKELLPSR